MKLKSSGDALVDAKAILEAIGELKRRGTNSLLQELEMIEPELASHVMEELGLLYSNLNKTAASSKSIHRIMNQVQSVVLVATVALRKAQQRLWDDGGVETGISAETIDSVPPAA
jgi:hypothetical protein